MDRTQVFDDCLRRLAAGESQASILARYPEHAQFIAPVLEAAQQMRHLAAARLLPAQRMRTKVALREALAARPAARPRRFAWAGLRALPAAIILAVVLFVGISISAVAQSRPGDLGYSLRMVAERTPVLFQVTPAGRASANVGWADRRLTDVRELIKLTGKADRLPLDAMLAGDQAAAERAELLSEVERARLSARVDAHAQELQTLAGSASDPQDAHDLRQAAAQARAIAAAIGDGRQPSTPARPALPTAPAPVVVATSTVRREPTSTVSAPVQLATHAPSVPPPTVSAPQSTPSPAPTGAGSGPWPIDRPRLTRTPWPKPRLTVSPPPWVDATPIPWRGWTATAAPTDLVQPTPSGTVTPDLEPTATPWPVITPWTTRTPLPRPSVTRTRIIPPILVRTPTPTSSTTPTAPVPSETPTSTPTSQTGTAQPAVEPTPTPTSTGAPAAGLVPTITPLPTAGLPPSPAATPWWRWLTPIPPPTGIPGTPPVPGPSGTGTPRPAPIMTLMATVTRTPHANRTAVPFLTLTVSFPATPGHPLATLRAGSPTPTATRPPSAGGQSAPTASPTVRFRRP